MLERHKKLKEKYDYRALIKIIHKRIRIMPTMINIHNEFAKHNSGIVTKIDRRIIVENISKIFCYFSSGIIIK